MIAILWDMSSHRSDLRRAFRSSSLSGVGMVEVVVILAMMMILALVIRSQYWPMHDRARRDAVLPLIRSLATGATMYRSEYNAQPDLIKLWEYLGSEEQAKYEGSFKVVALTPAGNPRCTYGVVKRLSPTYEIMYCYQWDSSLPETQMKQPVCRWGSGDSWHPCEQGMKGS